MSGQGFEVFNNAGYKIVGSDYANLCFYGKGSVQSLQNGGVPLPNVPGAVMYFFRSPRPMVVWNGAIHVQNFDLYAGVYLTPYPVEYWAFGPPTIAGGTSGFELYGDDGKLKFSTSRPFLKLLSLQSVQQDAMHWIGRQAFYDDFSVQLPVSGDIAFAPGNQRVYWTSRQGINPQSGNTTTDVRRFLRMSTLSRSGVAAFSTIQTQFNQFSGLQGNFNYSPNGGAPMTFLVADVSGL